MQQKFDIVTDAVESADFAISNLSYGKDPERAKELIKLVKSKRDELSKSLSETKNYKQAATKLKELNTLWAKDPELNALQANAKLWAERDKEERERIDKPGGITRDQYRQWKEDEIYKYNKGEGASFQADASNPEGTYNVITGSTGRLADLDKEFRDLQIKIAEMNPAKSISYFTQNGVSMSPEEKVSFQTTIDSKDANEIARETEKYLRKIPKFREWGQEVARYNYNQATGYGENLEQTAKPLVNNSLANIDAQIAYNLKNKKGFKDSKDYKDLLDTKEDLTEMATTGKYDPGMVQALYTQEHLNNLYNSQDIGEILAYKNTKTTGSVRKNYEWEASQKAKETEALNLAGFDPNRQTELNLDNIVKQRVTNAKALIPSIKTINNIADGTFRTLTNGWAGSDFRKKIESNPGLMRERQELIFNTFQQSKSPQDFQRKLWNAGIRDGNNAETAAKVFTALSNGNTAQLVSREIEGARTIYNNYADAKGQLENIDKNALNNKEYQESILSIGEKTPMQLTHNTLIDLAKTLGINTQQSSNKLIQDLKSKGVDISIVRKGGISGIQADEYLINANDYSKLKGHENLLAAIKAGEDFSNTNINASIKQVKQNLINSGTLGVTAMSLRYNDDPKFDKALSGMFLNVGDVMSFNPVGVADWDAVPGFNSKTGAIPGTKLLINDRSNVKLNKIGNRIVLEAPYEYIDEDSGETKQSTVFLDFKEGTIERKREILNTLKERNQGTSGFSKQTQEILAEMTFDTEFPNQLTQNTYQSATVDSADKTAVLHTVPSPYPGTSFKIVKQFINKDVPPKIMVKLVGVDGSESFVLDDVTGKPFATESTDKAKVFISRDLLDQ
jgi:hypothetical protein